MPKGMTDLDQRRDESLCDNRISEHVRGLGSRMTCDISWKRTVVRLIREGRPEEALALMGEKYSVKPPKLRIGTVKGRREVAGCYVAKERTIYLSHADMMLEPYVVLHEFYHHLRSMEGKFSGSEKHADTFAREFVQLRGS